MDVAEQYPVPYQFQLATIEQAVSINQKIVKCRGLVDVLISSLAPDVALADFRGAIVDYKDIKIIKEIGVGSFAKVYKVFFFCP